MSLRPDDLLILLAVARLGRFTAAADVLGVNHTTVSRRIAAIERHLGERALVQTADGWELTERGRQLFAVAEEIERSMQSVAAPAGSSEKVAGTVRIASPDGFAIHGVVPAAAALRQDHPQLQVELIAATQRLRAHRSGVDIEIVVGKPQVHKAVAVHLGDYALGLYATVDYLERAGTPQSRGDLVRHPLNYYIESSLQVDVLDEATRHLPTLTPGISSSSVFAHIEATRRSTGIGLLPTYMADRHPDLVRLLAEIEHPLSYWAVLRAESRRSQPTQLMLAELARVGRGLHLGPLDQD